MRILARCQPSWVLLAACTILTMPASRVRAAPSRPNIIFYLTDDMRYDMMGCAGNEIVHTPNLDRLAAEGARFTNMFCTTSICAVSRTSYLTGQHASRHGVRDFGTPLSPQAFRKTFPALLREAGYYTGFVGKYGLGNPLPDKEFDFWAGYAGQGRYFDEGNPRHMTDRITDGALEFLKSVPADRPFLLCVSTKAPHAQDRAEHPFQPAKRFEKLYTDVTFPTPVSATEAAFRALPPFLQTSEGRTRWQQRFATPEMYQASLRDYYRLVTGVDDSVGRIVDAVADAKRFDNTAFIFTSDNGFYLGEHGLAGKWFMHEESIRLPLIIRLPGDRSSTPNELVLTLDIAPTICDLAGIHIPDQMQGRSLLPLIRRKSGDKPEWRDAFFYEHHFEYHGRIPRSEGVRTRRWKYIRYLDSDPLVEELFDLRNDLHELNDISGDKKHAERLEKMRELWRELAEKAR